MTKPLVVMYAHLDCVVCLVLYTCTQETNINSPPSHLLQPSQHHLWESNSWDSITARGITSCNFLAGTSFKHLSCYQPSRWSNITFLHIVSKFRMWSTVYSANPRTVKEFWPLSLEAGLFYMVHSVQFWTCKLCSIFQLSMLKPYKHSACVKEVQTLELT